MRISRIEYDVLVRKRKRCRLGGSCGSDVAQGAPGPPVATDPEKSVFLDNRFPKSMYDDPTYVRHYSKRLTDLTDEIAGVKNDLAVYQSRIDDDSSRLGLGHFVQQGDNIVAGLTNLHDRTFHQREMHKLLTLNDLQFLYQTGRDFVNNLGGTHPKSHPKDPMSFTSKTKLIEALTNENEYNFDPQELLEHHYQLQNTPPPSPPTTPAPI